MDFSGILKDKGRRTVFLLLLLFAIVAFLIRMIPSLFIHPGGILYTLDTDTWYTLRQIEVMVHHFPQYNWYDPMTAFPTGKFVDWGPLYPMVAAVLCLVSGAGSESAIVYVSGLVAPLMAAVMVPVTYLIGKTVWDRRTGIVAAGLISVVSLIYFSLTTFGLVIHHIGETLFTSLFILIYLFYLVTVKSPLSESGDRKNLLIPVALATLAGVFYFLALITSTTTMLVMIVIAVFTVVQGVVDHLSGRTSDRLLLPNLILLSVSAILLVLFGIKQPGTSVTSYTIGLLYVNLALIGETLVLTGISFLCRNKKLLYLIVLAAFSGAVIILTQWYPPLESISIQAQSLFFGSTTFGYGVVNTASLSLVLAWEYFSVGLILTAGGFLILLYHIAKKRNPASIFLMVWSVIMILFTIQYQRFAYFSTVNIVLLSAICITEPFTWKKQDGSILSVRLWIARLLQRGKTRDEDGNSTISRSTHSPKTNRNSPKKELPINRADLMKEWCLGAVFILAIVLVAVSLYQDVDLGLNNPHREISPDWIDSVNWLGTHTPSPGIDYFQQYDAATFSYPSSAYGILANWEAGHWITFFSHRIPITNPFQDHLDGPKGAYAFFLSQNESQADSILQGLDGRYVITDSNLAVDNFASLPLWVTSTPDTSAYITQFLVPADDDPSRLLPADVYNAAYFRTMAVRLQNFDGSMQVPDTVNYIQYRIQQVPASAAPVSGSGYARVMTGEQPFDFSRPQPGFPIRGEGAVPSLNGMYADVFSAIPNSTLVNVSAVVHYRLVHESPNDATVQMFAGSAPVTLPGIKYVKIFERVKGARIPGTGVIEVPVTTNTGRNFTYRQESTGGEFVVPYSTTGNPYDTGASGRYHIVGTNQYFDVTEEQVTSGDTV